MDLTTAEHALHDRSRIAFAAAQTTGLPGRFHTFENENLRALLTTSPELAFLNSVSGVNEHSVSALPRLLTTFSAAGAPAPVLITGEETQDLRERLCWHGFTQAGRRPVAMTDLPISRRDNTLDPPQRGRELRVTEASTEEGTALFLRVLLAGYAASVAVSRFIDAEHRATHVRRFIAWRGRDPVAAGAMSVHEDVVVLGGAATLSAARGVGGQTVLVHHRLQHAATLGCVAATATAAPDSPSMRTLARAGFTLRSRQAWQQPPQRVPT